MMTNWAAIWEMKGDLLRQRVFSVLQDASAQLQEDGSDSTQVLEVVPRIAELIEARDELRSFRDPLNDLARATGLWNYIDKSTATGADLLLAESVTAPELGGITLHREQISALNALLAGKNLVLSAPTSFGKSILIDALVASGRYSRVAIVLPTIALLDEFRRRLKTRFGAKFPVVVHPEESVGTTSPVIFLGTQERLIHREDLKNIDIAVVDEFYKLDPARRDERSLTLNAAVYGLLRKARQFFFLGPNIDSVRLSTDSRWKFEFLRTPFSTVAVDTFDLRAVDNKEELLLDELGKEENWPAIVFVSSPDRANALAGRIAAKMAVSDESDEWADWLGANVGDRWSAIEAARFGFGLHHGRLPRAIASQMVRLFNSSALPILFCTSTLIEGVNTAAKSVFVYDKKINKEAYDFFTYSNIKGRAGRLGQHHVGKVFLFNDVPVAEAMEVAPTVFQDQEKAPIEYVIQLDEPPKSDALLTRIQEVRQRLGLEGTALRLAANVGVDVAEQLKQAVIDSMASGVRLGWVGFPRYNDVKNVVDVICKVRHPQEFGAFSSSQLAYQIGHLRKPNTTMREFFLEYNKTLREGTDSFDRVFKFLRACEYGLPQWFSLVQAFVESSGTKANYGLLVEQMGHWFRDPILHQLEEEGIPIQIAERFIRHGDDKRMLEARIRQVAESKSDALSLFERAWVLAAQ